MAPNGDHNTLAAAAEAHLAAIVASSHDAIISETLDGTIVSWNPAAERLYRYSAAEAVGQPIAMLLPPGEEDELPMLLARLRRGETIAPYDTRRVTKDGRVLQIALAISPVRDAAGSVVAAAAIARDATERTQLRDELQTRVRQQAAVAELGQRALTSDLESLMQAAVTLVAETLVVEYAKVLELLPDGTRLHLRAGVGWQEGLVGRATVGAGTDSQAGFTLASSEPVIVADLHTETRFHGPPLLHEHGVVSGLSTIIGGGTRPFGVLGAHTVARRTFTRDDVHYLQSVANVLAAAIARTEAEALVERRVDERTRELRALLDLSHDVAATLELGPLAGLILDRVKGIVDYAGAALFVLDEDGTRVNLLRYQGPVPQHLLSWRWPLAGHDHAGEVVRSGRPVVIDDVFADTPLARSWQRNVPTGVEPDRANFGAWLAVPLLLGGRVTGMLSVENPQVGYYTAHHAELLQAFAHHATVAVENARLYEQARVVASLEERQKLARELHDSVSQALFSIGLGARTARTLLDRDPAKAAEPLDYVVSLAEAGLTEMRALIFELQPDAMETEGLVALLKKQAAALHSRYEFRVDADFGTEPAISMSIKETLYRIVQEALQNIVRHANPSRVGLHLEDGPDGIVLRIEDDGVGFEAGGRFPGHLGLRSMRERAARHGAVLEVDSAPGRGTRLRVCVPPAR